MGLVSVGRGVRLAAGHMLDIYTGIRILLSFWQKKDKERFDYFGAGVRNLDGDMDCNAPGESPVRSFNVNRFLHAADGAS